MNLFWKKAFGKLTPTEKFEKEEEVLMLAYKRYCEIEASEQLKEYTQLFHLIKSADFKEKKKTLQNRKFKDTQEYRDFRKYEKLHNSLRLKQYYHTLETSELADFLAFKATPEYEKLGDPKAVKEDVLLQKMKGYEKSSEYKNYVRFHGSFIVSEYEKLKKQVATEEFIKSKTFWENKNRWQTVPEYKQEQRYYELQRTPDIMFYESTDPKSFDKLFEWKLTFSDEFAGLDLDASKWKHGYFHRSSNLKKIYSFANEKQANTDGKNIYIDGSLKVRVINEAIEAPAWDYEKGFINKSFSYTSGVINTGETFQQTHGLFKAKIRVSGDSSLSHAFWLGADGKLPHINIFNYNGGSLEVSSFESNGSKVFSSKETIKGINPAEFYIYSLEWTPKELIWRINNLEVHRETNKVPRQALFPAFNSFISDKNAGGEGHIEVDWVRAYTKN
jgi:hypothetical protein